MYRSTTAHSLSDSHPNDATLLVIPSIIRKSLRLPVMHRANHLSLPFPARLEKHCNAVPVRQICPTRTSHNSLHHCISPSYPGLCVNQFIRYVGPFPVVFYSIHALFSCVSCSTARPIVRTTSQPASSSCYSSSHIGRSSFSRVE